MKKLIPLLIAIIAILSLSACGSGGYRSDNFYSESSADKTFTVEETSLDFSANDFDTAKKLIDDELSKVEGIKDSGKESKYSGGGFSINYKLLIPTAKKSEFINALRNAEGFEVETETTRFYKVADESANLTAKKQALTETYNSLNTLLTDDSQDKVSVVKEMSLINEQIKQIESEIAEYDSMRSYSTVYVSASETVKADAGDIVAAVVLILFAVGVVTAIAILYVKYYKRKKTENKV